ncbi:MAG: ArsA family ATPase [Nitrososphaerota archaeon]|nr:ArsA family ATPase [Nitrososphaerales archaeon]MDW8044370.1 ArsA family ATPase [Nitrososphaerota archaeon]
MQISKGLDYLDAERPRVVIFCGKGGVGKTTCATATAFHFAKVGLKTLIISTDPTPSLSDIFEVNVRGVATSIRENLTAIELDYNLVIERWKERFGDEVYAVISSFLPVGKEIIDYIAGAPGIDEEFALSYVLEFYERKDYDVIVWDTAPAGGTLSLIKLQDRFYRHLEDAARLYIKVRHALDLLTGGRREDPLKIIKTWKDLAQRVFDMLKDKKTHAIIVTIPEALGVYQTKRIVNEFKAFGINITRIIINYVITQEICNCDFHRERATMQKNYIRLLDESYGESIGLTLLPQLSREVKGIEAVKKVESLLFQD